MPRTRRRQHSPQNSGGRNTQTTQTNGAASTATNSTNNNTTPGNTVDIDSSDTEIDEQTHKSAPNSKPKLQIFKGQNDKVTVENWFKRFEMLSKFYKWSDSQELVMLGNYLEDDALNWYIENYQDKIYSELKDKMNSRFGLETVEPIVEFVNLRYDFKTGIKEYFETKRRLGVAAKLTESQMIPLLILNLPNKMAECFTAVKPSTFAEFYAIAKTAENNFKKSNFVKQNSNVKPNNVQGNVKSKRKPPDPCRICEKLGFKNRYHWSQDCRNKGKTQPQNQNQQKSITNCELTQSENDLTKIDLN